MGGLTSTPGAGPSQPLRTTKETHPNLPPGLILDPDGKVCKVCNSWQDWGKMKVKKKGFGLGVGPTSTAQPDADSQVNGGSRSSAVQSAMATFVSLAGSSNTSPKPASAPSVPVDTSRQDCPADTAALGRSTWTFLHTTAAYYPLQAPRRTQENMISLLSSLSLLYPCVPCASDFQDKVRENPPDVSGREALSRWLCERHNEVNEKLGKETFACDWGNLNARWKDGPEDGRCD